MKNSLLTLLALGYLPLLYLIFSDHKLPTTSDLKAEPATPSSGIRAQSKTSENPVNKKTTTRKQAITSLEQDQTIEEDYRTYGEEIEIVFSDLEKKFATRAQEVKNEFFDDISAWHISVEDGKELSAQYAGIELTRVKAQALLDELEFQKQDYDDHVKDALGEEAYNGYLTQQKEKFLTSYVDDLEKFVSTSTVKLKRSEIETIKASLSGIDGGVTVDQSAGPYGKPPVSELAQHLPGSLAEKNFRDDRISLLTGELNYLVESLNDKKLQAIIQAYYSDKINRFE